MEISPETFSIEINRPESVHWPPTSLFTQEVSGEHLQEKTWILLLVWRMKQYKLIQVRENLWRQNPNTQKRKHLVGVKGSAKLAWKLLVIFTRLLFEMFFRLAFKRFSLPALSFNSLPVSFRSTDSKQDRPLKSKSAPYLFSLEFLHFWRCFCPDLTSF